MNSLDTSKLGILDILAAAFRGEIPESSGPKLQVKEGEVVRGIITSQWARQLGSAPDILQCAFDNSFAEHRRLHEEAEASGKEVSHDCQAFYRFIRALESTVEVLAKFFSQAVVAEFPQVIGSSASVKVGWELVTPADKEWNDVQSHDFGTLFKAHNAKLRSVIIGGEDISVIDSNLGCPVQDGEEVLGVIEDSRLRGLWTLYSQLTDDINSLVSESVDGDTESGDVASDTSKVLLANVGYLQFLRESYQSLFWLAVRNAFPSVEDGMDVGIRDGWNLVKCPHKSGGGIEKLFVLLSPLGAHQGGSQGVPTRG